METLAIRILMQAQLRVMARTDRAKWPEMARDFAHVRNNLDKYRNTSHLRRFFSHKR